MKKAKLFVVNTFIIMASSLVIKIITSIFDIYLANKIGAEALGIYSQVLSIYMFLVTLATSGINLATTKVISEEVEKKNDKNVFIVIRKAFIYSLIFSLLSGSLLILFTPTICEKFLMNKISHIPLYVLAVSLPFISLTSSLNGYFYALRKVIKSSITSVSSQLVRILVIAVLVNIIFKNNVENSILALVIGNMSSEMISFFILYYIFKKESKNTKIENSDKSITTRMLKISLPIAITSYIRSFLHTIKHLLIPLRLKLSGMSYEKAISNYGIITGMAFPIVMFPSVIVYSYSSLLIPEFSRFSVEFNKEKMNKDISKLFKITLYFCIFVTGVLMCFGKTLGNVFYNNSEAGYYIKLIAPLIPLMYLDNVVDNILKGLGKQVSVMCCNIFDLIISVSFIYYLLPIFSTNGYIIVLYISEILNYTISVITLFRTTDLKFKYFDWFIFPLISTTISLYIANLINFNIANTSLNLFINIFNSTIIYILLIYFKKKAA